MVSNELKFFLVVEIIVPVRTLMIVNVYEVWIKYNLDIETPDGVPIDSWFLTAYGKTPHSYLLSRSKAIQEASVVALRDALVDCRQWFGGA